MKEIEYAFAIDNTVFMSMVLLYQIREIIFVFKITLRPRRRRTCI
jgi:hypothetical protein